MSGLITFDNAGFRNEIEIDIYQLVFEGMKRIGKWNASRNIEWIMDTSTDVYQDTLSLQNTTFRVLIALVSYVEH